MTNNKNFWKCRVCGFDHKKAKLNAPWVLVNEDFYPSYEICPSCNCEFGFDDEFRESVIKFRNNWINSNLGFYVKSRMPKDWDIEEQLEQVEEEWK